MYIKQLKIACLKKQSHKKALGLALLLAMSAASIQAQEAISSAGGTAATTGGSISYTVGQTVYTANSSSTGTVEQGVQQAYTISVISALSNTHEISIICTAYPNPTSDYLTLAIAHYNRENLRFDLLDENGKAIKHADVTAAETKIEMNETVSGTYFLKITEENTVIKIFKIIKQN